MVRKEKKIKEKSKSKKKSERKGFTLPTVKLPKWAFIILLFLPASIEVLIVLLVDHYVGFPENVNPIAILAITGLCFAGGIVIIDMFYRNIITYNLLRKERVKAKVYKDIIRSKQEKKSEEARFEEIEDEYVYEEDEEDKKKKAQLAIKKEYQYVTEEESAPPRSKSFVFRGGIATIFFINGLLLLILSFILQLTYGGGFNIPDNETSLLLFFL